MRIFILAESALAARMVDDLTSTGGIDAVGGADVRQIRQFAASGPVDAVVVHESAPGPAAATVAPLLRRALGAETALVLGVGRVLPHDESGPFDATMKLPLAPRVCADRLRRAIRERQAGDSDQRAVLADIEIRHARLEGQDHYGVLGVSTNAAHDVIVAAWDRLSLAMHPDRLRSLNDAGARDRAEEIYTRAVEAARVLRDPEARAKYDRDRGGGGRTAAALPIDALSDDPRVQKYLRLAKVSLVNQDRKMARVHLEFAARMEPDNAMLAERLASLAENPS